MLYDDCGIRHKRPEIVGLKAGVSLEMFEEGGLIGIIIRVCTMVRLCFLYFYFLYMMTYKIALPITAYSK